MAAAREVKSAAASIKPVITYDFKHPNRVSKDQIRTLENIHSSLAKNTFPPRSPTCSGR